MRGVEARMFGKRGMYMIGNILMVMHGDWPGSMVPVIRHEWIHDSTAARERSDFQCLCLERDMDDKKS